MVSSIDRLAVWNIVATVDAFLTAGFSPAEVMRYVHPSMVANTMGTGMGGGQIDADDVPRQPAGS